MTNPMPLTRTPTSGKLGVPWNPLEDALTSLELEVARRADELARARPLATSLNLHCWLLAEAEVLAVRVVDRTAINLEPQVFAN